jgi:hypothetical protein
MQMQSDVVVTAFKASKGEYQGKPFDSTKVYLETGMLAGERSRGLISSEYTWGTSDNYSKIENIEPPFKAKAIMQQVSNGRDTKVILIDLIPEKSAVPAVK